MRCGLRPILRISRHALPVVVLLAVASTPAFAESLVCQPIRRGESATQAARRVTGDARNTYQTWFQIMNASSRFVPKSQYNRVRAGWRACIIKPLVEPASSEAGLKAPEVQNAFEASRIAGNREAVAAPVALTTEATSNLLRTIGSVDLTMVWLGVAMVVPWFGWRILDDYLARRKTTSIVIRHFAHRFVDEFERPLVRFNGAERPLRSRLRRSARRGRFEILLAPGKGRRYPNLSDHKKNVEYDLARVMRMLADDAFVCGRAYTQAGWVVLPFEFKATPTHHRAFGASSGQEQAGVTCISSF
jgi:hypothetical protein